MKIKVHPSPWFNTGEQELLVRVITLSMAHLGVADKDFCLNVLIAPNLIGTPAGGATAGKQSGSRSKSGDEFFVVLSPTEISKLCDVVVHESIHVQQHVTGDLYSVRDGIMWKGKLYHSKEISDTNTNRESASKTLPWEKDAYDRTPGVIEAIAPLLTPDETVMMKRSAFRAMSAELLQILAGGNVFAEVSAFPLTSIIGEFFRGYPMLTFGKRGTEDQEPSDPQISAFDPVMDGGVRSAGEFKIVQDTFEEGLREASETKRMMLAIQFARAITALKEREVDFSQAGAFNKPSELALPEFAQATLAEGIRQEKVANDNPMRTALSMIEDLFGDMPKGRRPRVKELNLEGLMGKRRAMKDDQD